MTEVNDDIVADIITFIADKEIEKDTPPNPEHAHTQNGRKKGEFFII
jgi:hypothetical protein